VSATQSESSPSELRRVLGPLDATCVVVGAIIGVGIFFTPSQVARIAGSGEIALLAWTVGGFIALMGALTFAELGGLYPSTGGQYTILRDSYGPLTGFLYVFCNATAIQAGAIAIIAVICANHLAQAAGRASLPVPSLMVVSSALIGGLMIANILGVRWGSRIQNVTVYAKVLTLLAVTALAIFTGGGTEVAHADATAAAADAADAPQRGMLIGIMFAAMIPAFFSFGGWQQALWIAGEVRQPGRNVPLGIILGVSIVVAVYLLVNWAYLRLLGYEGVVGSQALAADAVANAWSDAGRRIIAGAVAISAFGVLNAQLLTGPRLINGMARDGRFFHTFAAVNSTFQTPVAAILLLGGIALVLLHGAFAIFPDGTSAIDQLLTGVVIIDSIFFALTGFALIVLRYRQGTRERPVRVPGYPVVPLLFVLGEVGMLTGAFINQPDKRLFLLAAGWIVAAGILYFMVFHRRAD